MILTWATDLHLDKLENLPGIPSKALGEYLRKENPDTEGLLLTGDISIARLLRQHLGFLQDGFQGPIYYVLGNHDFYGKSWEKTAELLRKWDQPQQFFLDHHSPLALTEDIWLVGRSGWFDARLCRSVEMAVGETRCILDAKFDPSALVLEKMRHYADQQADKARKDLKEAYQKGARKILFLTHYPPYQEATWHEGQQSEDAWVGLMTSVTMGLTLDRFRAEAPDCQVTVLCGHTHSPGECHRSNGIRVLTGSAVYNYPAAVPGFEQFDPQDLFKEGRLAPESWPMATSEATC